MNDRRSFRTRRRRLDPSKSPASSSRRRAGPGSPRDFRFFTSIRRHTRTRHVSRVDSAHRDDARARRRARDDDDAAIRARDDDARRVIVGVIIITGPNLESNPRRRLGERGRGDASSRRVARCRRGLARVVVERGSIGVDDDARAARARAGRRARPRRASDLVEYLNDSWTAWHATEAAVEMLENAGYERISETAEWGDLRRNGKYYVTRNASALVAFAVGGAYRASTCNGFNVVAAHGTVRVRN